MERNLRMWYNVQSYTHFFLRFSASFFFCSSSSILWTRASCLHLKREGVSMLGWVSSSSSDTWRIWRPFENRSKSSVKFTYDSRQFLLVSFLAFLNSVQNLLLTPTSYEVTQISHLDVFPFAVIDGHVGELDVLGCQLDYAPAQFSESRPKLSLCKGLSNLLKASTKAATLWRLFFSREFDLFLFVMKWGFHYLLLSLLEFTSCIKNTIKVWGTCQATSNFLCFRILTQWEMNDQSRNSVFNLMKKAHFLHWIMANSN